LIHNNQTPKRFACEQLDLLSHGLKSVQLSDVSKSLRRRHKCLLGDFRKQNASCRVCRIHLIRRNPWYVMFLRAHKPSVIRSRRYTRTAKSNLTFCMSEVTVRFGQTIYNPCTLPLLLFSDYAQQLYLLAKPGVSFACPPQKTSKRDHIGYERRTPSTKSR
jgi:hypothetical protein